MRTRSLKVAKAFVGQHISTLLLLVTGTLNFISDRYLYDFVLQPFSFALLTIDTCNKPVLTVVGCYLYLPRLFFVALPSASGDHLFCLHVIAGDWRLFTLMRGVREQQTLFLHCFLVWCVDCCVSPLLHRPRGRTARNRASLFHALIPFLT